MSSSLRVPPLDDQSIFAGLQYRRAPYSRVWVAGATRFERKPEIACLAAPVVLGLVAALGHEASWRYVEFFTANIRNPHTRRACARACGQFFAGASNEASRWPRPARTTSPP